MEDDVVFGLERSYGDAPATVANVHDGDTIAVNITGYPPVIGQHMGVRLYGIDCAELHDSNQVVKDWAIEAREYVKSLIGTNPVMLHELRRDKYFRLLAIVAVGDMIIADKLLAMGYAKPYTGGAKSIWKPSDCVHPREFVGGPLEDAKIRSTVYGVFYVLARALRYFGVTPLAQKSQEAADAYGPRLMVTKLLIRTYWDKYLNRVFGDG